MTQPCRLLENYPGILWYAGWAMGCGGGYSHDDNEGDYRGKAYKWWVQVAVNRKKRKKINAGGTWEEQSTGHGDQFVQAGEGWYKRSGDNSQISKIGGANLDGRMMRSALVSSVDEATSGGQVNWSGDLEFGKNRESIRTRSSYVVKT